MAERVLQKTVTIPAGTPVATPVTIPLPFDGWEIEQIDLEVAPGPTGLMGFYLANNGQPWIPRSPGEWLIWDDQVQSFTPTGYPSASGWEIVGYNLGEYPHQVATRFHVNPVTVAQQAAAPYVLTFVEHDVKPRPEVVL